MTAELGGDNQKARLTRESGIQPAPSATGRYDPLRDASSVPDTGRRRSRCGKVKPRRFPPHPRGWSRLLTFPRGEAPQGACHKCPYGQRQPGETGTNLSGGGGEPPPYLPGLNAGVSRRHLMNGGVASIARQMCSSRIREYRLDLCRLKARNAACHDLVP